MKKVLFTIFTILMGLMMPGCEYDDSELLDRLGNLEERVVTLEQLCQQMNTNISAMQTLVDALQTRDHITAVTPISEGSKTIGYTITFAKSDPITIYHGQDGKDGVDGENGQDGQNGVDGEDGYTPVIGVDIADDGIYYWTLDGEWLLDKAGDKIRASGKDGKDGIDGEDGIDGIDGEDGINGVNGEDGKDGVDGKDGKDGITPKLKIESGYWYISYDEGTSWERLGRATGADGSDGRNGRDGDAYFSSVTVDETNGCVTFVLKAGNKTIQLPFYKQFSVEFTSPVSEDDSYVIIGNDKTLTIEYTVTNPANDNLSLAVISDLKTTLDKSNNKITVHAPATIAGMDAVETVTLLVSNGNTTVMAGLDVKVLDFAPGVTKLEIQTPEDLLRWGYLVNHKYQDLGIEIMNDIEMPAFEIEADDVNETYVFTDTRITVDANGVPSGSNWIPLGKGTSSSDLSTSFKGSIDGKNNSIKGLYINNTSINGVGFVGWLSDGLIKDLTLENSVIHGENYVGGVVGYNRYNTKIENVHLINSDISGKGYIGGIVGSHYRRLQNPSQTHERLPYIINCTTDKESTVIGSGNVVGGICGYNYGANIIHCVNEADVSGNESVGGVVGDTRSYDGGSVNGYVIASGSTENAEIKGTANAGGIVGYTYLSPDHAEEGSKSYVVACFSKSTISSTKAGTIVGNTHISGYFGQIISSWAIQTGTMPYSGNNKITLDKLISSNHYSSATDITEDIVSAMNAAIDEYNKTVQDAEGNDVIDLIKCHYKWQKDGSGWPTLVTSQSLGGN